MNKILFIIPYFGNLPQMFQLYLNTCSYNSTVDWLILTDDKTHFSYPKNVKVVYVSFEDIQNKIKNFYEPSIYPQEPYKLCTYKPAYGELFREYTQGYDFWGHCDLDMIWGDIRKFYTEEVLSRYDRIGWQGHSTLYRNTDEVNERYLKPVNGVNLFYEACRKKNVTDFDEGGMSQIYDFYGWDYYKTVHFAHPSATKYNFELKHLPTEEFYKNKAQIFHWDRGKLIRMYVHNNKVCKEEFMYLHLFRRIMDLKMASDSDFVILPHSIINMDYDLINANFIKKHSRNSVIRYYLRLIYDKKKIGKLKIKYIIPSLVSRVRNKFHSSK